MDKQSNTQKGPIRLIASGDLTGKEGYLIKVAAGSKFAIAGAASDAAVYVCDEGNTDGNLATGIPLTPDRNFRIKVAAASNGGSAGDVLDLQSDGTVNTTGGAGARLQVGIAEEAYVADQLVKVRPLVQRFLA